MEKRFIIIDVVNYNYEESIEKIIRKQLFTESEIFNLETETQGSFFQINSSMLNKKDNNYFKTEDEALNYIIKDHLKISYKDFKEFCKKEYKTSIREFIEDNIYRTVFKSEVYEILENGELEKRKDLSTYNDGIYS